MNQGLKQRFDADGYVVLPGFLSLDEVAVLHGELDRYIAEVVPRLSPGEVFYEVKDRPDTLKQLQRMFEHDAWFRQFFFNDRFVKLAELLLGSSVIGKNLQWFNKPPGIGQATPPHQDGYYFMLEPNEAVTMWLALDEVNEANGCVRYVAGSQRCGLLPHERTDTLGFSQGIPAYSAADRQREIAIIARPGDLLVHHALTLHRADANTSPHTRRALGLIYYSATARENTALAAAYRAQITAEWAREGKL